MNFNSSQGGVLLELSLADAECRRVQAGSLADHALQEGQLLKVV
jgi:hypothetical protein